jgi:hypothetical protein
MKIATPVRWIQESTSNSTVLIKAFPPESVIALL